VHHRQHLASVHLPAQDGREEVSLVGREGRNHEVGVRHSFPTQKLRVGRVILKDQRVRELLGEGLGPVGVLLDETGLKAALLEHPGGLVPNLAPAQNHNLTGLPHAVLGGERARELFDLARPPDHQQTNAGAKTGGPADDLHVLVVEPSAEGVASSVSVYRLRIVMSAAAEIRPAPSEHIFSTTI
jgi:hypothetical protein